MAQVSIVPQALRALGLLLDIYAALMILLIASGPLIFGLSPFEGLLRLGAPGFYLAAIAATVLRVAVLPTFWRRTGG